MLVLPEVKLPKDAVRLCLGAGETPFDDYQNFDFFSVHENVTQCDLRRLPFEDNSVDEIFALQPEHIPHPEILTTFTEWLRVLKPNGYFSMNFPDFVWVMKNWLELPEEERWGYKFGLVFGMQNTPCDVHYTGFTKERAINLLTTAGFSEVRAEFRDQFDHQRVWAFARKPMQPNTSSTNENLAGSVLPAAMLSTKLFYDSKLKDTDYNWIKREAEYDAYKKWVIEYKKSMHEQAEQIDKLTAALEEKQEALLENVKMLDSLSKTIESKVQMLQEHVAIIGEKDTQLAALAEEVARLNKLVLKR